MRAIPAVLLLAAAAAAAPDAHRTYKKELHRLEREEKVYWRGFHDAVNEALKSYRAEMELAYAKPDEHKEAVWNYEPMRSLYERHERIAKAKGEADAALAASGHEKAVSTLFGELLDLCKRVEQLEEEMAKANPTMSRVIIDQRLGIERTSLAVRRELLLAALARCPDAALFLADDAWKRADKTDGRRSIARRVAVIDAVALAGGEPARAFLEARLAEDDSSLRIAALEGLLRSGQSSRAALRPLLDDPAPPVRRALLEEIAAHGAGDAGWIEPVLERFPQRDGRELALCLAALEALTKQRFGYEPAKWKEWLAIYREEIAKGAFDKEKIEIQEVAPAPPPESISFYGVRAVSRGIVFLVDGSQHMWMPADLDVERTRFRDDWPGVRNKWESDHPSHLGTLLREFERTLRSFPPDARFGVAVLYGRLSLQTEGDKRLLKPVPRDVATAMKLLERIAGRGWCSPYLGLEEAARLAGMPADETDFADARADTVYLLHRGDPAGGRYMTPESALAAFRRLNRFRRMTVHTLRISDFKEPAETFMKGVAEASGGTYVWLQKPPK